MMQRPPIAVRAATAGDAPRIIDTLARAFGEDPALSYIFRDAATRPAKLQRFFALILAAESDIGLTDLADGGAAAAIWRPPGAWKTPTSTMLRHAPRLLATFGLVLPRTLRLQAMLEAHHPETPHWYLEFVGCDPAAQGRGLGGAAIRARLARCDASGMPAALETATEANLAIYGALGFAVTGQFDVPDGPRFWTMWREAR